MANYGRVSRQEACQVQYHTLLMILAGYFAATVLAGVIVGATLRYVLASTGNKALLEQKPGIGGMGKFIGYVERFLIITLMLIGFNNGIGFVLAAKSILRYGSQKGDEDKAAFTEYVIFGTLLSYALAIIVGAALLYALRDTPT